MLKPSMNTKSTNKTTSIRVFVGLSGGVDSAVSAGLLKRAGFDVTGVFIKTWHPDFLPCTWRGERRDAMRVALALDIPFLFFDFEKEYKKGVADRMIAEYAQGRTPNPDVLCNREVKFGAFWKKAKEMGADCIATGHYVRAESSVDIARKSTPSSRARDASDSRADALRDAFSPQCPLRFLEGKDKNKDQSYFLWTLNQDDLAHTLFPIGHLEKREVRKLAKKFNLPVAEKKDSQGICFIGEVSMDDFLSHFIESKPGDVLNEGGEVIGRHKGALYYTLGERHGFEVTEKSSDDGAYYVVAKDMGKNTITVSNSEEKINKMSPSKVSLASVNWIREPREGEAIEARIRYRGERLAISLSSQDSSSEKSSDIPSGHGQTFLQKNPAPSGLVVEFDNSARGLSLGQSIVFYSGNECLGGAVMDKVLE